MDKRRLALLKPHQTSLERCVYCPKLSRAACPVSNAEASETVTPWGKMSLAYFAYRGDVPIESTYAAPAWACSACYACRERCEHRNEVATVLNDARAEFFSHGVAPDAAQKVAATFASHRRELRLRIDKIEAALASRPDHNSPARSAAVLVGCGYAMHAPKLAEQALDVVQMLLSATVRAVRECCGLPLLYAGDHHGFRQAAQHFADALGRMDSDFVAVDPGCARAVLMEHAQVGVDTAKPQLFIDVVARSLDRLRPFDKPLTVRYHDPCQLGRGLNRYNEPRLILSRLVQKEPEEFIHHHEHADCSGGGGLLPLTRPWASVEIANSRIHEHRGLGGGLLVTHCGQSLRRLRSRGERAADVIGLVARALLPQQEEGIGNGEWGILPRSGPHDG